MNINYFAKVRQFFTLSVTPLPEIVAGFTVHEHEMKSFYCLSMQNFNLTETSTNAWVKP